MKIICKGNRGKALPEKYLVSGNTQNSIFSVSIGISYIVYGICLYEDNTIHYLLMGDLDLPSWYPAELFTVAKNDLPMEWYYKFYSEFEQSPIKAMWGYNELINDLTHYEELIERKSEAISIFLKRKIEIDEFNM